MRSATTSFYRVLRAFVLVALASCLSRAAEQRYAQRVEDIDREYRQATRRLDDADQQAAMDLEALEQQLVPVSDKSRVQPIDPVAENDDLEELRVSCEREEPGLDAVGAKESYGQCILRYRSRLWSELVNRYWAADVAWVVRELRDSVDAERDESFFVFSHNGRLRRYLLAKQRELDQTYRKTKSAIQRGRTALVAEARRARDAEIQEAYIRLGEVVSAAARGFLAAGASGHVASSRRGDPFRHCSSDIDCGIGNACVKPNFSAQGTCARTVDEHGLPLFTLPNMDSVFTKFPGEDDCRFDTDCPFGFRCSSSSGACFR
jgi:hypothetical protein